MAEIKITLEQLESMLREQKQIVIERLSGSSSYYNSTNTDGCINTLPIDKDKFKEHGMQARYPSDFEVLKKYLK